MSGAIARRRTGRGYLLGLLLVCAAGEVRSQQGPSRWMEAGAVALRQGNPKQAEEDFRRELEANPASADAHLGMGVAQLRAGEPDASITKAIELNPEIRSAHMFRGIAFFQMNSLDQAIVEFQEELKVRPKDVEALTWLGIVELQAGRPKQAAEPLDRAGTLMPGDENILYYQVRAHTLAAQESFRALFKIDPDSAFVHRAQAEIDAESEQPDKAIAEYQAALKRSPSDPELYEALGDQEQKVSRTEEATKAYQAELAINPHSAIALLNLGKIQVETGNPEDGIVLLQRAVEAHAIAAPTDFYLGLGLLKVGKNEDAAKWLERSLASMPSDFIRQRDYYELARVYQKLGRSDDSQHALDQLKKLKAEIAPNNQSH
jgi:tetratricopeptide (TPR) repeat protein